MILYSMDQLTKVGSLVKHAHACMCLHTCSYIRIRVLFTAYRICIYVLYALLISSNMFWFWYIYMYHYRMAYVANQNCQTGQNLRPTGLAKPDRARLLNIQGFRDWTPCQHAFSIIGGLIVLFRGVPSQNFL